MLLTWIKRRLRYGWFPLVFLVWTLLLWLTSTKHFDGWLANLSRESLEKSGFLGDTFGAFSALMAAFAAVGAILALAEQRHAVKRQMFVTTIVAMLDRLQQTIEDTDFFVIESIQNDDGTVDEKAVASQNGQSAFYEMSQELRLYISENFIDGMSPEAKKGLAVLLYRGFYEDYKDDLGHFFRQLYHIIRYIDEVGDEEKERFIKIVRASLTNAQLLLLAYNVIAGEGRIKFSRYIAQYSLLHNLGFETDELGLIERELITERLGSRALVSQSEQPDRLRRDFLNRERANALAKESLRDFLNRNGLSINYGVQWRN